MEALGKIIGALIAPLITVYIFIPFMTWLTGIKIMTTGSSLIGTFYILLLSNLLLLGIIGMVCVGIYTLFKFAK